VAVQYEIEKGVVVLRLAPEGFFHLSTALRAAAKDQGSRTGMPLLLDLRGEPPRVHYGDMHRRTEILAQMREQFGPRWAFLVDLDPARPCIARMFATFSEVRGLNLGLFSDKDEALRWLRRRP
jgi:hypothetical protein